VAFVNALPEAHALGPVDAPLTGAIANFSRIKENTKPSGCFLPGALPAKVNVKSLLLFWLLYTASFNSEAHIYPAYLIYTNIFVGSRTPHYSSLTI